MTSPTHPRTVSELIEVWQDWTTFIEQKKRSRRWTMDETSYATPENELGDRASKRKKRGRYSDGHQHQILRSCLSFPEEMDVSFTRDEGRVRAASVDENNLSLMDISEAHDVNMTALSLGDAVNDSVIHIGCIDSDGNPLDVSGEATRQMIVRRETDASNDSPDELKLYSSIDKSIDIATPMKLVDVFQEQHQQVELDESMEMEPKQLQADLDQSLQISEIDSADESDTAMVDSHISVQCLEDEDVNQHTDEVYDAVSSTEISETNDVEQAAGSTDTSHRDRQNTNETPNRQIDTDQPDTKAEYLVSFPEQSCPAPLDLSTPNSHTESDDRPPENSDENLDPQSKRKECIQTATVAPIEKKLALNGNDSRGTNAPCVTFADEQREKDADSDPITQQQQQQQSSVLGSQGNKSPNNSEQPHTSRSAKHKSKRNKRRSSTAVVEQDAAFAFSPYRSVSSTQLDASAVITPETDSQATSANEPIQSMIQQHSDSILEQYLDKMNSVNEFYANAQPFRIGKRNLPLNQVEVVLRRRAIKKPEKVRPVISSNASVGDRSTQSSNKSDNSITVATGRGSSKTPVMHSHVPRPPSRETKSSTPRRTLFPNLPSHSRNHSLGLDTTFEDDSTISSATVASNWTTGNTSTIVSANNTSILHSTDPIIEENFPQKMPQEEVIGDTSLGLKLTILHGKVIVQAISPLEDGRASPAQLCGLFCPGDVLIAVNGSSLIDGSIHTPVPMDKMVAALKPLSEPIDGDGCYSREVRLRFVTGEGKKLLREQKERELRKQRMIDERKKLGLDGKAGSASIDHAADIFGLSALMGVDQFTGMPMFQEHHLETHHDGDEVEKSIAHSTPVEEAPFSETVDNLPTHNEKLIHPSFFSKNPPLLQCRISQQVADERRWMRNHNTSTYFTLDSDASLLLRPPSPPIVVQSAVDEYSELNPVEARQKRLDLGAANISHAQQLVSNVENQERGIDIHDDEDPMEVASRVCGTASVRTGASRRRWHRGDSVIAEDAQSTAVSASSMDNQADANTIHSEESVEVCDHRLLVDLAANNHSWRHNVIKRLEGYAADTEKAIDDEKASSQSGVFTENEAPSSLDTLLFGGDVAKILSKKKNSLALPPGEMTQMLFDLREHLESGLPIHIFTSDDGLTLNGSERAVTSMKTRTENDADVSKAKAFLLDEALHVWLKSFRPLPWKQRRALWPLQSSSGANSESGSMVSSHFDDGMSLSMASGGTHSAAKAEKRNLREIIEELELDPETRRETCELVTFYFTHNYQEELSALQLIDAYGSYLDLYKAFVLAGKLKSLPMVKKLVSLAKFDPQHRDAMKGLQKAKVLLFYEKNMLSALHELLQTGAYNSLSANFDIIRLLVSAYPDLDPMIVRATTYDECSDDFYFKYMSLLMHPDEGSDAAKRDSSLVKEWCSLMYSSIERNDGTSEDSVEKFYQIASASQEFSSFYWRDLPFLLDMSIKISQYELALDIAKEIFSSSNTKQEDHHLADAIQHLRNISEIAIVSDVNPTLLGHVIIFYTDISKNKSHGLDQFDVVDELTKVFQQCIKEGENNPTYDIAGNLTMCLTVIAENASPSDGLKVLFNLDLPTIEHQSKISAVHTLLNRGAYEHVGDEICGSLLRIQRVREERRRFELEESMSVYNFDENEVTEEEEETDGFVWSSILEGRMSISK